MKTENEILKEFIALTGADEAHSKSLLITCQWDIQRAHEKLKETCSDTGKGTATKTEGNSDANDKVGSNREGRGNKISRGFSMVDPDMVSKFHNDIKSKGDEETDETYGYFQDVTHFSFTLPDFSQCDNDFLGFLMKDLVETSTLRTLENSGHLNWWTKQDKYQRLLPLATSGDGNCLLHAASLGIWGVHDRLLNLRQAVHRTLCSNLAERTIKRRWYWYEWVKNVGQGEIVWEPTEKEWEDEWHSVLTLARPKPRNVAAKQSLTTVSEVNDDDASCSSNEVDTPSRCRKFSGMTPQERYESLEEIHIFSLAHVLRRPIIVVADTMLYDFEGNALSPIPFGGVYLPVECDPAECCRVPLVLAYSSGHFSPLVAMETQTEENKTGLGDDKVSKVVIPLVDKSLQTLPLPFAVDPGKDWDWRKKDDNRKVQSLTSEERISLLSLYIDVVYSNISLPNSKQNDQDTVVSQEFGANQDTSSQVDEQGLVAVQIVMAELPCNNQPTYYKELIKRYITNAEERFSFEQETKIYQAPSYDTFSIRCANDGCDMYGTVANNYLCTKCFQLQTKSLKEFAVIGDGVETDFPPSEPPSYAEAVSNDVFFPPSFTSVVEDKVQGIVPEFGQLVPTECKAEGCTFYGTADRNGYCSKCYHTSKL